MLDNIGMPVQRHQPVAQRGRAHLAGRRRDLHRAQGGPRARRPSYVRKLRTTLARDLPGADVLLPRARHLDPGAQLRPRRAHRRAGRRRARQRGRRPTASRKQIADAGAGRSPARSTCTSPRCLEQPELRIDVDRTMAGQLGLTERDVASDLLVSLASSAQVSPSYWLDKRGVQYLVAVQTPQYDIDSLDALDDDAHLHRRRRAPQLLSNVASVSRTDGAGQHHPLQRRAHLRRAGQRRRAPTSASVADGGREGRRRRCSRSMPRGTTVRIKGQVESMAVLVPRASATGSSSRSLLVYLLMVVNFQSWLDPLVILMALPGALAGIAWMLFLTHTTLSVPALMGAIMCVGVATANSILVVTFANDQRQRRARRARGGARRRDDAPAPGHHDGAGDDHRHAPDVARPRRGRRAERAARPRRHRRAARSPR